MFRLQADFTESFCASREDGVRAFADACLKAYGSDAAVEICESDRCVLLVRKSGLTGRMLTDRAKEFFFQTFSLSPEGSVSFTVNETEADLWSLLLTPSGGSSRGGRLQVLPPEERIETLIGAEQFKILAKEIVSIAPAIVAHRTYNAFSFRSYLFSVNDGCGYSTCLTLFAELIEKHGLFHFEPARRVVEEKLLPPTFDKGDPFSPVTDFLRRYGKSGGMLLSIDIREWISETGNPRFRRFLSFLEDYSNRNIFVFRVPFLESEVLAELNAALRDVLYVRPIAFPPMNTDQLCQCASRILAGYGFTMAEDARRVFCTRIQEEKSDGRFYGINTVNKIICEMIYRKHLHDTSVGTDTSEIRADHIQGLSVSYGQTALEEGLDSLVGLESVKQTVEEMVSQIEFALRQNLDRPCIHMRFVGNPGTGKTSVARIVGKMLKERGVLRHGHFFEYSGRDFCGRYVGQTAPKTTAMCRDAYGSVLFIDEAYSLYRGDEEGRDFGREALDTLLSEMENHRSDLVVIMAGYPDEMARLLDANPGLESRMPYLIEFPNYTRAQLTRIFFRLIGDTFPYDEAFSAAVRDYFEALPEDLLNSKTFSNARFVRNLFERTCAKAVTRHAFDDAGPVTLTKEDFIRAGTDTSFRSLVEKKSPKKIGF